MRNEAQKKNWTYVLKELRNSNLTNLFYSSNSIGIAILYLRIFKNRIWRKIPLRFRKNRLILIAGLTNPWGSICTWIAPLWIESSNCLSPDHELTFSTKNRESKSVHLIDVAQQKRFYTNVAWSLYISLRINIYHTYDQLSKEKSGLSAIQIRMTSCKLCLFWRKGKTSKSV